MESIKAYRIKAKVKNGAVVLRLPEEFEEQEIEIIAYLQDKEDEKISYRSNVRTSDPKEIAKMSAEEAMLRGPALSDEEVLKLMALKRRFEK